MVDSAVSLSISTELDLSGFEKGLAALKNQKIDFGLDTNDLGKTFRDADRQLRLTPKVDLSQLHALNKLLDVKLNHFKQVQRHFDANPLSVKVNQKDADLLKAISKPSAVAVKISGKLAQDNSSVKELQQINKNTKSSFLKTLKTGAVESIGARAVETQSSRLLSGNAGKGLALRINKAIDGIGDGVASSLLGFVDTENAFESFVESVNKTIDENLTLTEINKSVTRIRRNLITSFVETENLTDGFNDAVLPEITAFGNKFQKQLGTIFYRLLQVTTLPLKLKTEVEAIRAGSRIVESVKSSKTQKRVAKYQPEIEGKDVITVVSGGFQKERGGASPELAEMLRPFFGKNAGFVPISNVYTDRSGSDTRSDLQKVLKENTSTEFMKGLGDDALSMIQNIEKLLKTSFQGINPDAARMAATALSIKTQDPSKKVQLAGFSGGGYIVEQAVALLEMLSSKNLKKIGLTKKDIADIKGVGIGSPLFGFTNLASPEKYKAVVGRTDPLGAAYSASATGGLTEEEKALAKSTGAPTGLMGKGFMLPPKSVSVQQDWKGQHDVQSYVGNKSSFDEIASMLEGMSDVVSLGEITLEDIKSSGLDSLAEDAFEVVKSAILNIKDLSVQGLTAGQVAGVGQVKRKSQVGSTLRRKTTAEKVQGLIETPTREVNQKALFGSLAYIKENQEKLARLSKILKDRASKLPDDPAFADLARDDAKKVKGLLLAAFEKSDIGILIEKTQQEIDRQVTGLASKALEVLGVTSDALAEIPEKERAQIAAFLSKRMADDPNVMRGIELYENPDQKPKTKGTYEFYSPQDPARVKSLSDYIEKGLVPLTKGISGEPKKQIDLFLKDMRAFQKALDDFVKVGTPVPKELIEKVRKQNTLIGAAKIGLKAQPLTPAQPVKMPVAIALPQLEPVMVEVQETVQEALKTFSETAESIPDAVEPIKELAPVFEDLAPVVAESSAELEKLQENFKKANEAITALSKTALESFSTTAEELKAFLMPKENIVLAAKKKGQPDLRTVGKTLGVPTKNLATGKAFKKEELIDYLLGNFDIKEVQSAIAKVGAGLPKISPQVIPDLTQKYADIQSAIDAIDLSPIEEQLKLWDELEQTLIGIDGMMNHLQKVLSFDQKTSQQFQGRRQAFGQQYEVIAQKKKGTQSKDIGQNLNKGIAGGIKDSQHLPEDAIRSVAEALPEIVKDEWEIKSPSRLFERIAKFVIEGLEAGLDSSNFGRELIGALLGIEDAAAKTGKEIVASFSENLNTPEIMAAFGSLKATVSTAVGQIFNSIDANGGFSVAMQKIVGKATVALIAFTDAMITRLPGIITAVQSTVSGAMGLVEKFFSNVKGNLVKLASIAAQAFVLTKLVGGLFQVGQASVSTALEVDRLTRSLSFSTAEGGVATLEKLRKKTNELNISFIEAAQGYSQLAASTLGTNLQGSTDTIFEGVATAVSARGLDKESQSRAFTAISQIASKGKVSMEELSGQLGESLPGSVQVAARAMGMGTQELIKFVSTGQLLAEEFLPKFAAQLALESGSSVAAAAGSATAQLTKFNNALEEIKAKIGAGILAKLQVALPIVNSLLGFVSNNIEAISTIILSLVGVLSVNLGKALFVVASELKVVNLFLSLFGVNATLASANIQSASTVTRGWNTTLAVSSTAANTATVSTGRLATAALTLRTAFMSFATAVLPLVAIGLAFQGIMAAMKPVNAEIVALTKQAREANKTGIAKPQETGTPEETLASARDALTKTSAQSALFGKGVQGSNPNSLKNALGLGGNDFNQVSDILTQQKAARETSDLLKESRKTESLITKGFKAPSMGVKQEILGLDKQASDLRLNISLASAKGESTAEMKAELDKLTEDRKLKIEATFPEYGRTVSEVGNIDKAIASLTEQYKKGEIAPDAFVSATDELLARKGRLEEMLTGYADATKVISVNVQNLAFAIGQANTELEKAQTLAQNTATKSQTDLIGKRLSGEVSSVDFARAQQDITGQQLNEQLSAIEDYQTSLKGSLQGLEAATLGQLEAVFNSQGFTGGIAQFLESGSAKAIEQAKSLVGENPALTTALESIGQIVDARQQGLDLEKQIAEFALDRRQQELDLINQGIDLSTTKSTTNLVNQRLSGELDPIEMARQQSAITKADLEQKLAAARESKIATNEVINLEKQLADLELDRRQQAVDLIRQEIDLNNQRYQSAVDVANITDEINSITANAATALSDFDQQMLSMGNSINQSLRESVGLQFSSEQKAIQSKSPDLLPQDKLKLETESKLEAQQAKQKAAEAQLTAAQRERTIAVHEFDLMVKQNTASIDFKYQTEKNAILTSQSLAKTADAQALAQIGTDRKLLDLDKQNALEKIRQKQLEADANTSLFERGMIDAESYADRMRQSKQELAQLEGELITVNQQSVNNEIDNFQKIKDQLKSVNDLRVQVIDAQIKGQERLTQSTAIYSDALSKQAEIIQAVARIQQQGNRLNIQQAEQAIAKLEEQKGAISSLASTGIFDKLTDNKKVEEYRKEVEKIVAAFGGKGADLTKLAEMDQGQLSELKATIQKAQSLGVSGSNLQGGLSSIEQQIQNKSLEIAREKAELMQKEQETQRKLLAIEIERNRISAQAAIREAEIAAVRAKNAVIEAKIATAQAQDPYEKLQAQLGLQLATEEFQFALANIDVSKQGAVINNRLAQLQKEGLLGDQRLEQNAQGLPMQNGGFGFSLDASTRGLANIGDSMKGITDFSSYEKLLTQIQETAKPLEAQIEMQQKAQQSSDRLNSGIDLLNAKIEKLIVAVGRPNITVGGGGNIKDVLSILEAAT